MSGEPVRAAIPGLEPVAAKPHDSTDVRLWNTKPGRSVRVLLVDDSEDDQLLIATYLRDSWCELIVAENGLVAWEQVQHREYDLILMDIDMPVMDGLTATRRIRESERSKRKASVPIIALTVHASSSDRSETIAAGCTAHLTKPITRHRLLVALDAYRTSKASPDTTVQGLLPGYIEGRRKEVVSLRAAVEEHDLSRIARIGHNLKGTGAPYGFPEISEIGASLERAGKQQDEAEARRHITRLEIYLKSIIGAE